MNEWRFPLTGDLASGERRSGVVDWRDEVLTGWEWPFIAVNGALDGPSLLVTAGVHGSEYTSIDAAIRFAAALDPERLRGQVLVLPLLNPPAFWRRVAYVCPIDGKNLNRVFPGDAAGSFSERLACRVTEGAIRHADAFIDLHGGDIPEALVPFTIYERSGRPDVDARTYDLAEAFGQPIILAQDAGSAAISGPTCSAGARLGVPSIIVEDGGLGVLDPDGAHRLLDGLARALAHLDMSDAAVEPGDTPRLHDRFVSVRAREAGFFRPRVAAGERVATGATLGTVVDFFDRVLEDLVSPVSGEILFLVLSSAMEADGLVCGIAEATPRESTSSETATGLAEGRALSTW